jgi:hypothetical protein
MEIKLSRRQFEALLKSIYLGGLDGQRNSGARKLRSGI